jgi:ABC-type glycerol-3-phosphate transport system substrate-binding protein
MKKIYAILVALSALSIVLAGCGSKSDDSGTKTNDTTSGGTSGGTGSTSK